MPHDKPNVFRAQTAAATATLSSGTGKLKASPSDHEAIQSKSNPTQGPSASFLLDRVLAAVGLLTLLPLLVIVAIAIIVEDRRPVFFRQVRLGQFGKPFEIWKFRSMRIQNAGPSITAAGDHRILKAGKYLRKYKIDELPQLWNVIKGQMRLVGPRPEVPEFADRAASTWQRVLAVPPGITDLATLVFRNEEEVLSRSETPEQFYREQLLPAKLELNIRYMMHRCFLTDVMLVLTTACYCVLPGPISSYLIARLMTSQGHRFRTEQYSA